MLHSCLSGIAALLQELSAVLALGQCSLTQANAATAVVYAVHQYHARGGDGEGRRQGCSVRGGGGNDDGGEGAGGL